LIIRLAAIVKTRTKLEIRQVLVPFDVLLGVQFHFEYFLRLSHHSIGVGILPNLLSLIKIELSRPNLEQRSFIGII
jgi:hypothetical protein